MAFNLETNTRCKLVQVRFEVDIFSNDFGPATMQAGSVVVMIMKLITQFEFVFPPSLQALHDTETLEQRDGTVDAGAVDARTTGY